MKKIVRWAESLSESAYCMVSGSLKVACTMLFCSFLLLVHMGAPLPENREMWLTARELASSPAGILLVGNIAGVLLEERSRQ